ncbi:PDDEXK family nuclease [Thermus filiformis]|uniref:Uncharacterized protein n=1 Tax=Thermus filiformis TaxID=276 RepID=A0A0A2X802_THEFI|nr:hypothetical protein [Thermus filiformis]KGQ21369.1 hypothetical protein THFILI_02900 [Thermus filiformis]
MVTYVSLLGNDPGPVYAGLKLVKRRAGRVGKVVLYAQKLQEPQPEVYRAKREALYRLLKDQGLTLEEHPISHTPKGEAPFPKPGKDAWVNLTGGSKFWAALLLEWWWDSGAQFFLLDAQRPLEPPYALFLWPEEKQEALEDEKEETLSLEDYLELYLEPLGEECKKEALPSRYRFPSGARAVRLLGKREETHFAVYRGRPYLFKPFLVDEGREMTKEEMSRFREESERLGGQNCLPIVLIHRRHLNGLANDLERKNKEAKFKELAKTYKISLMNPAKSLEEQLKPPPPPPAPPPEPFPHPQGSLLVANVSDQTLPIYAAYLALKPKEVYLAATPEMREKMENLKGVLQSRGARVRTRQISASLAHEEVRRLFAPVAQEADRAGHPMYANLNGGTTALALGLHLAIQGRKQAQAHYFQGDRLYLLSGEEKEVPWKEARLEEVLALYGRQIRPKKELGKPRPDPEVAQLARSILNRWEALDWSTDPEVRRFFSLWKERFGGSLLGDVQSLRGLVLEYLTFYELDQYLAPRGGKVAWGGHLTNLDAPEAVVNQVDEVDILAFYRGKLWIVECKMHRNALSRDELENDLLLARMVGGLRAGALAVVARWEGDPPEKKKDTVYMALEAPEGVQGVFRFPEELPQVLDKKG